MRYLGGGHNLLGEFHAYVTVDERSQEQWWIFTVSGGKVIAID